MTVKAVFFDLFETLVTEFSEGSRISKRNYDYMKIFGLSNEEYKKEWRNRSNGRMTGLFPDYPSVLKDMLIKCGRKYDEEAIEYLYQERIKEKEIPFDNTRSDIVDLLSKLKNKGMKLGLISNCTEEEIRSWHRSDLAKYFDVTIFSYEVGLAKPDKKIYQLACDQLLVEPAESIFVGDGGSKELDGAYHAGLTPYHAVWFNPYIDSDYKKIDDPSAIMSLI
ncbi:HAD family hydrolase [Paenibacillaceae bacterium]|nr:HAD family hydrolase [Paenibacillaceae bacterium]